MPEPARAAQVGYHEQMIGAGRRVNDSVAKYVAQRILVLLSHRNHTRTSAHPPRVAMLGVTFKENVPDTRNSKVAELIAELQGFGLAVSVHDAQADAGDVRGQTGLEVSPLEAARGADCIVLAVPHREYMENGAKAVIDLLAPETVLVDIRSSLWDLRDRLPAGGAHYWAL